MSFLLRRLRSKSRGHLSRRTSKTFTKQIGRSLMRLENLEQRALLDAGGFAHLAAGPATHVALLAPPNETAGSQAPLEVVALDASNHLVRNFTGTVSFTSTDGSATLPTDYTFTASDRGLHLFHMTLATPGSDTVTATDSADSISGDITVNVNPAPVATHFLVYTPENTTVGKSTGIVVVALDASNHRVDGYTGTVTLTTDDPGVTTPPLTYTFTSSDHGIHVFNETFATAGVQTVTATDDSIPPLTGTASLNVNPAPVATHFLVYAPENTTVGKPTNVVVIALDASNHRVDGYTGTVTLTPSDASLAPITYTFAATDHGIHVFQVTFANTGAQTVDVADDSTPQLTGTASINVNPAPVATHFAIFAKGPIVAGQPFTLEVVALDASNHRVPNYAGTVHLASSVAGETLPADYTFTASDEGEHEFQITLNTPGSDTLTASDGTLTGSVMLNVLTAPTGGSGGGSGSGSGGANFAPPNLSHFDAFFAAFSQARRWRG